METQKKKMKIGVTGSRPPNMGGFLNSDKIKIHMKTLIEKLGDEDTILISGGALGIDQLWIEVGIDLKLFIVAALPFIGYDKYWLDKSRETYKELLDKCSQVLYISDRASKSAYQVRNKWIVDNVDLLVAYHDGFSKGTRNCINYAKSQNKNIIYNEINL